ncbi:Chitin-binding domain protein cbd-1 like protein [Argiope bruennichi]|uniref:Chitin-binding domain protein cbd-1 like protein n=1 Tax=Argiope bruennichi TaxID=94029 RepID=A0A8T0E7P7_ARGBR|nr:Chitin-binding domain protein cbd-1 like protein [Argiope bruennichi]
MMCDREEYVQCLPSTKYLTDLPIEKQNRQTDDVYHVFRPEDLYTETLGYIPRREQPVTKVYQKEQPITRTYQKEQPVTRAYQKEQPVTKSRIKRQYPSKHLSNPIQTDYTRQPELTKTTVITTRNYDDTQHSNGSTRPHQIEIQNGDFDAACRKGDTGFFPDYASGCKMFHICFKTIRKTYSCPSVLLFNPETKNCDLPENVFCTRPEPIIEETFDCKGRTNQFVPDYASGCKNYIGCINNLPYRFLCPKGKIFSLETAICEPESNTECRYPLDYNSTDENIQEGSEDTIISHRHVHSIPGQFFFTCTNKPDGFYPDYNRHCHVFYRCVRGKKFSHYCKQGLLFNPDSGICDFEENVKCTPNNGTELAS